MYEKLLIKLVTFLWNIIIIVNKTSNNETLIIFLIFKISL